MDENKMKEKILSIDPMIRNLNFSDQCINAEYHLTFCYLERAFELTMSETEFGCCFLMKTKMKKKDIQLINRFNLSETRITCFFEGNNFFFRRIRRKGSFENLIAFLKSIINDSHFIFIKVLKGVC